MGRRIAELGGDLIDGIDDLIDANKKVDNLSCPIGNSFVPGTRVVMADGSTKPIEEVDVGEKVLATDPKTGEQSARTVLATIIGSGSKHLVEITVDPTTEREALDEGTDSETEGQQAEQPGIPGPVAAGDVVIATDEHPFWVPDLEQWVDAVDLAPGMWLQTSAGTWVQINAIQAWSQPATVHNLTVQGVHTYHVAIGSSSPLVHNDEPCGVASPCDLERTHSIQGNASSRNVRKIAESMKNDGWQGDPIAVVEHEERLLVVDGHHRVSAAKRAGIDVPYVRVELPHRGYQDLNDVLQSWYSVGSDRIR